MRPPSFATLLALAEALAPRTKHGTLSGPSGAFDSAGLLFHRFPAYHCTPVGADIFANTGGDGVHYSFLPVPGREKDPPVVMTVPMNFGGPYNFVVGENLVDFLSLGCKYGYFALEQLAYNWEDTVAEIERCSLLQTVSLDEDGATILAALTERFSLAPWRGVGACLRELEARYAHFVVVEDDGSIANAGNG